MITECLEELRDGNNLKNFVIDYYIDRNGNDNDFNDILKNLEDLQRYGCISGMITSLIYYDDTIDFYHKYQNEINDLLSDICNESSCSISELFGEKFDSDDPLVLGYNNQNLLAWFGFENMASKLYDELYEKSKENEFVYEY